MGPSYLILITLHLFSLQQILCLENEQKSKSEKSVVIKLVKSLSSNLQKLIASNNDKLELVLKEQLAQASGFRNVEEIVSDWQEQKQNSSEKISRIESELLQLKNQLDLDKTLWIFNTQVCNASIHNLRSEMETKFMSLAATTTTTMAPEIGEQSSLFDDFMDIAEDQSVDIFKEFDKALAEYEEDLLASENDNVDNVDGMPGVSAEFSSLRNPVDSLLATTNKILRDIDQKYQRTSDDLTQLQNFNEKILGPNLEDKLNSKISNLELKYDAILKALKQEMKTEDDAILENVKMRSEDFNIIRKTTNSRLSVYETRLDTMEQMMFEMDEKVKSQSLLQFSPTSTTKFNLVESSSRNYLEEFNSGRFSISTTTESGSQDDFSLFGLDNLDDLNNMDHECLFPPCGQNNANELVAQKLTNKEKSPNVAVPELPSWLQSTWKRPEMQSFNIQSKPNIKPWDEELSRVPRNEETVLQKAILEERKSLLSDQGTNCNCDDIKIRTDELEQELKFLSNEVNSALTGMRGSMTALLRRIEILEARPESQGSDGAKCVATKEAKDLPGMDDWCKENCRKGNCPSHLCSCPINSVL